MTPQPVSDLVSSDWLKSLVSPQLYREAVRRAARPSSLNDHEDDGERAVVECLRYLYLLSAHPDKLKGQFLPVEQAIDEIWHYLILQTREYRVLCEDRLPGRFFIHHRSVTYAEHQQTTAREVLIEQALRWLPLYRDTFGPFDEQAAPYWTMVRFLRDDMCLSLVQIEALGR
jgi:hypothetical protein